MNRALAINHEIVDLQKQKDVFLRKWQERMDSLLAEQRVWLNEEGNDLKPAKTQKPICLEKIVSSIYEACPETRGFNSPRLLAYIKDFARRQGIAIDVCDSRIRHLKAWKERRVDRESGNTRYGYNPDNFSDKYCD